MVDRHTTSRADVNVEWLLLLESIFDEGHEVNPRGQQTKELLDPRKNHYSHHYLHAYIDVFQ